MTSFAQAHQFINAMPYGALAENTDLAEAVAHLKDALAYIIKVQIQKPAAYVSAATMERLEDHRIAGIGAALERLRNPGCVPIFTAPRPSSEFLVTVRDFATVYLSDERQDPAACANPEHHQAVCGLFAAIETEERRAA